MFVGGSTAQSLPTAFFNDVEAKNIMPAAASVDITFKVDMKTALATATPKPAQPFNPATDSVFVNLSGDGIWAFTQGIPRSPRLADGYAFGINRKFFLTDADKDGVYEGTMKVKGPTYNALQYLYAYGNKTLITEAGGGTSTLGRRRTRYIYPSKGATGAYNVWPTKQNIPDPRFAAMDVFQETGALPFEKNKAGGINPVGVEPVGGELPNAIALSNNYPNPFNPATTFEYTINQTAPVTVQIFDMTGRLMDTLVNETQSRNTYRVTFDASRYASGTYIYRLQVGTQILSRKMTFLK